MYRKKDTNSEAINMAADPDFISLVETNRLHPSMKDLTSPKAKAREQEKKEAFLNENIFLRLVPKSTTEATTWTIPRFRLTESFLQEAVNRGREASSPTLLVSHLHERRTNTVVLPKEVHRCRASPVIYDVHTNSAIGITKGGVLSVAGDSYYKGDVVFVINVPQLSKSEYEVIPDDIHRWLVQGAISGLETMQIESDQIETLRQDLQQLENGIKNVHVSPVYNEHGRAIVGSPLKDARERKFEDLQEETNQTKRLLEKAKQSLEALRAKHISACLLLITNRSEKDQNRSDGKQVSSFSVKVQGKKKTFYTELISNKTDWNLIPLYATGDNKSKQKSAIDTTSGVEHYVDLGGVSIEMLPDGFGVLETYSECNQFATSANGENNNARGKHSVFHGNFREGQYHKGILHTDAGVYSGTFMSNEPRRGTMKYSDGIILTGGFTQIKDDSPLGPNRYSRGLPHGNDLNIHFKNGAIYEGEMHHGSITGNGSFRYPRDDCVSMGKSPAKKKHDTSLFNEIKGDFVGGVFQNNNGIEGRGASNLLRSSMMFGGERLCGHLNSNH